MALKFCCVLGAVVFAVVPTIQGLTQGQLCGQGYESNPGDIVGWGQLGSQKNVESTAACAERCNANTACKSYEYSPTDKSCNLNRDRNPAPKEKVNADFAFCSKILDCNTGPTGCKTCVAARERRSTSTCASCHPGYELVGFTCIPPKEICGDNYELNPGDIGGWGQLGSTRDVPTTQACADRCDADPKCNAYEYSTTEKGCSLNHDRFPHGDVHLDYAYCSKVLGCLTGPGGCKTCVDQHSRRNGATCESCNPGYDLIGHTCILPGQACGNGFELKQGDIGGVGQLGSHKGVPTTQACAERCEDNTNCNSYEYSSTKEICNLNRDRYPHAGVHEDYAFCSKADRIRLEM